MPTQSCGGETPPPQTPNANRPQNWRINREVRFTWRQQRTREWICFREIAEWYAERNGRFEASELARAHSYDMLMGDLLAGMFDAGGKTRVLYLHFATPMARMTRAPASRD